MTPNIPPAQNDQTLEAYVALIQIENAIPSFESAKQQFFGRATVNLSSPNPTGLTHFLTTDVGSQFESIEEVIRSHCLIAAYWSFIDASTWNWSIYCINKNNTGGITKKFGMDYQYPFHRDAHYCPECARREFQTLGYAYAHRTHQLKSCLVCPEHLVPIGPIDETSSDVYQYHGLLIPTSGSSEAISVTARLQNDEINQGIISLSRWSRACFYGEIPRLGSITRVSVILERMVEMTTRKNKAGASWLNMSLLSKFSQATLVHCEHPLNADSIQWPFLFLNSATYHSQPITNLLILSAVFDDPRNFRDLDFQVNGEEKFSISERVDLNNTSVIFSKKLLHELLRGTSLEDISKIFGVGRELLGTFLERTPLLFSRRGKFSKRVVEIRHRRIICAYLSNHPNSTRTDIYNNIRTSYNWILKNDRDWLECEIHSSRKRTLPADADIRANQQDEEMLRQLIKFKERLLESEHPEQITRRLLRAHLRSKFGHHVKSKQHPKTSASVNKLSESPLEFKSRMLDRIEYYASINDIETCSQFSVALLKRIRVGPNTMIEILKASTMENNFQSIFSH